MQLSIVIVNWNTLQLLEDCLVSVFAGLGEVEAEVLVVDNASSDGSVEMVEAKFPQVTLIRNSENRGFAAANNQAMEIAKGRYVLLLNSDTVVHGDVLARSTDYLDDNTEVGAMGCRVLNTDGTVQVTGSRYPSLINLVLLTSGLDRLPWPAFFDRYQMRRWARDDERDLEVISGCYLMVRQSTIEQVGLLDENFFFFGEETDWCKRLRDAGWILRFAPVGEITHHGGGSVRKLNFKRDLMLSSAMIKLHLKHNGRASALATWAIVIIFNATRAAYWSLRSVLSRDPKVAERRAHFVQLIRNIHHAWPSEKTYVGR